MSTNSVAGVYFIFTIFVMALYYVLTQEHLNDIRETVERIEAAHAAATVTP